MSTAAPLNHGLSPAEHRNGGLKGILKRWGAADAPWTAQGYRMARLIFGAYLMVHFVHLIPWAAEVFSNQGMLPDASASPLVIAFPNVLGWFDAPWVCTAMAVVGAGLSGLLALGRWERASALGLWVIWASFFGRNPLISNPGLPYVGLLLMVIALTPSAGPLWSKRPRAAAPDAPWSMPKPLFDALWVLMAVGYSYSGLTKLTSPSWLDGSAFAHILGNPLARGNWLGQTLLELPEVFIKAASWSGLGLELLFAPLALFRKARPWLWFAALGMHLSLIALIDFADLSLGMVMLHLLTFDMRWLKNLRSAKVAHNPQT